MTVATYTAAEKKPSHFNRASGQRDRHCLSGAWLCGAAARRGALSRHWPYLGSLPPTRAGGALLA